MSSDQSLKYLTAKSVKWNAIDRLAQQVIYAVTGIVLARLLSPSDFGLVGVVLIFQAFASLLVDSGFSYALIQRKAPSRVDYSTVLWFNLAVALFIYFILYVSAPMISGWFGDDPRLIPMSRVMFVTFVLNASSIVQINRLTKNMNVRPVAVANAVSLAVGGGMGIVLAVKGFGAWALVWQSVVSCALKSVILWLTSHWLPMLSFSWGALKGFFSVGGAMMTTSLLNTIFTNIYSFFIGNRLGLVPLGYYTQSDKWSKMGIMSILQTLTSSFLPPLSAVQDDPERFRRLCSKMNRMTAYLVFPLMFGLILMAAPIFHTLFGDKWDLSIALFQLLVLRGIFTIITGVYNNFIVSLGKARVIVAMETVRDGVALTALLASLPFMSTSTAEDPLLGIRIMLYGQILASIVAWVITLISACRVSGAKVGAYLRDLLPYLVLTLFICPVLWLIASFDLPPVIILILQCAAGSSLYIGANCLLRSKIQAEAIAFAMGKMKK